MKTFTTYAEKKAKQFLNLLQGYTKGIRMTVILVLLLMGVSNAWGANNEYGNNKVIYLDITNGSTTNGWRVDQNSLSYKIKMYYNNSDNSSEIIGEYCCTRIGTSSIYYTTTNNNYVRWVQALRCAGNCGQQHNYSNRVSCASRSYNHDNCIILPTGNANWWDTWTPTWTCYVPGIASASINNTSTVYGGDGTEANPYQILVSSTLSVNASATSIVPEDNAPSKEYQFSLSTNSGTRTTKKNFSNSDSYSFTASATAGTTYAIDVEARNNNNSNIGKETATSSTLYFITIEPIYAILGSFNDWTHSANTWDLSDQGSSNWKATFHLDKGSHTFKVVHNSSYYGKNNTTITRASATASSLSTSGADINLTTDIAGNYTFTFNSSSKNLTVTYPAAYTVTYGVGTTKGTTSVTTNPSITSGSLVLASTSITFSKGETKTGYQWKNWNTNANGTGTNLGTNATYTSSNRNANTTVYACYDLITYNITYNLNGGTGATNTTYNVESATITLPTAPTKTGYTFAGWYDNANLTGNKVTQVAKGSTGDKTFYAKWTANQSTITWNANGGSVTPTSSTYIYDGDPVTLPTPTRTGYTFNGWFTASSGGSKINDVGKDNKPTSNKTYYAQWTENKFDVTIGTDGNGTTTNSGIQQVGIVGISVTATPNDGYEFVNWTKTGDVTLSNANTTTTTIKATGTGSVTANFKKIDYKTIYLKPGAWASNNARFAVYAFGNGKEWYDMEQSDYNNEHYQCDINGKYTTVIICRMNPSTSANDFNNGVLWNQTADLTIPAEGMCFYDRTKIYLKPNANWKAAGARFAAYFYLNSDGDKHKWMSMLATDEEGVFYCNYPTEEAYDRVIFCRMNGNEEYNNWGNRYDQTNGIDLYTGGNIYTINDGQWGGDGNNNSGATGTWSYIWREPTYPLTLKATPYGEYTVKCNGVSYTSSRTKDIVINLPVGATVEITKAESYDAAYNSNLVIKTSSNSPYEAAELNTTYTFCGETTIEENFTTTADHVVFLRVATSGDAAAWNNGGTNNYVYSISNLNRLNDIVGTVTQMTEVTTDNIYKENGYTYYTCIIPQGCSTFRFERKAGQSEGATNKTEYFEHLLPLGQSNCFTIEGKNTSLGTFYGDWGLGTAEGDYRILYVEQQVAHGTDENAWKTVIDTTYQHSSDIIKKGDGATIVSLHIDYDKTQHPEVILQKFTGGEWVDVEGQAHMVLGPLTASADMAMLPGRRNVEGDANLRYGDGIEEIKDDAETGIEGRVWNFTVQQSDASAYIDFTAETFAPYEGNYYIRTDNAAGGWMTYAIPSNVMSRSEYSLEHSDYSHYFCKWVKFEAGTPNTKFVVANKYGAAISDTIVADDFTDVNGTLTADANVRWMWNEYTNIGSRAYIAGSSVSNFLVAKYVSTESQEKTGNFKDMGDWVYEADLKNVQIDDKLTSIAATYATKEQELLEKSHVDAGGLVMLASTGNARTSYTVRIVYDFKINQTICYLIPTGAAVATSIDVLIERINQDEEGNATQVTAAITPANAEGLTVYGLITLTKDHITGPSKSEQEALTYWISFPFDVKIGDITGFGEVGKHWMIKYYDGAERAEKGWFLDTKTFWKFFLDTENVMKANRGYVLTLNKSLLNESNPVYDNTETLRLYFPSMNKITTEINSGYRQDTVHITEHWCNITSPADRTTKDSHWNMIGVPSFANKTITTTNETVKYFYDYSHKDDKYNTAQNAGAKTFKPMHAYMVQFAGVIDWNSQAFDEAQKQLAAKKNADAEEQYTLRLELQQNGTKADQTFVELHDDATTMFDMNVDLTKMFNTGANIYTLIGSDNQVAANVMPIANTVIPVGVQIAKAGEYTFAMPDGTDGITVELIDYETNTRTNLLLSEYTVDLNAGTFETRFALHVKPSNVTTSIDPVPNEDGQVRKLLMNGQLYLFKDGQLYDAQGKLVR